MAPDLNGELPPIPTSFTTVVAMREFEAVVGDEPTTVLFEVGAPTQDVETVTGFDWRSPVRITAGDTVRQRQACGVDSFQALQLALTIVDNEAKAMSEGPHGGLRLFDAPYDPAG